MATLLGMLNDLRVLLREERITSISTTDELTQALILVINRAARNVLESHDWDFDVRNDGVQVFNAPIDETADAITAGDTTITYTGAASDVTTMLTQPTRMLITDASSEANTGYRVLTAAAAGGTNTLTLSQSVPVAVTSGTIKLFANEARLASTVGKVLSARHEETPIRLAEVERHIAFDSLVPRDFDSFQANPDLVYVGSTVTDTAASGTGTQGMGMMIWPPQSARVVIHYSYQYAHAALSAATDTFAGVPNHVSDLIVDRAFLSCLTSNIQNDPERAIQVRRDFLVDLERAKSHKRRQPNRRRVLVPFGERGRRLHPNIRWTTREISAP